MSGACRPRRCAAARVAVCAAVCAALCAPVCALVCAPSSALAEPSSEDRERFQALVQSAVEAYKAERFDEAIVLFESALRIEPSSPIYWNLAVIYEKRDDIEKALKYIDAFLLDFKQSEEKRDQAFARREQLMARQLELRAAQEREQRRRAAEQAAREEERARLARLARLGAAAPQLHEEGTTVGGAQISAEPRTPPPAPSRAWVVWSTAGVALLGVAGGLHLYADSIWQSRPLGGGEGALNAQTEALTMSWVADGLLVLGGSALTYGLLSRLLSSPAPSSSAASALRLSPRLAPGLGGLSLEGAF